MLNEEWADEVLDVSAREGEHLGDHDLGIKRTEERVRDLVDDLIPPALLHEVDDETRQWLVDAGHDQAVVDEAFRRVRWLEGYVRAANRQPLA